MGVPHLPGHVVDRLQKLCGGGKRKKQLTEMISQTPSLAVCGTGRRLGGVSAGVETTFLIVIGEITDVRTQNGRL